MPKFNVGDRVRTSGVYPGFTGTIFEWPEDARRERNNDDEFPIQADDPTLWSNGFFGPGKYLLSAGSLELLEESATEPAQKFKVGDRVMVQGYASSYWEGGKGTVVEVRNRPAPGPTMFSVDFTTGQGMGAFEEKYLVVEPGVETAESVKAAYEAKLKTLGKAAYDAAVDNAWCGEFETVMEEIGLSEYLPTNDRVVRLTLDVEVEGGRLESGHRYRGLALDKLAIGDGVSVVDYSVREPGEDVPAQSRY